MSLDSTGQVQKGGGLSIYKDATTISTVCPSYLDVDAVFDSSYLVTYFDSSTQLSNLITVQVDESTPNVATVTAQSTSTLNLYEFITLDQSSGVIVAIAQDTSSTEETAIVVAGSVDSATGAVTLSGSPVSYANEYSVYPQITRLSDSLFAISYYTYDPFYLATRYGKHNFYFSIRSRGISIG